MITSIGQRKGLRRILLWTVIAVFCMLAVWLASFVPNADWYSQFDPAARGLFQGRSPYDHTPLTNPPWAALLLMPFVILPRDLARGLILVCSLASWIYIAWRLRAPKGAVVALMLSPTAIAALLAANLDAFVMLGALLPPMWGLFALVLKPQVGLGAAVYDLIAAWREHKMIGVVRTFAPVVTACVISSIAFPIWIDRMLHITSNIWNRSMFPYSVPLGLLLLWASVRRRNVFLALASTPFLAPYITFPSYLVVQIGFLHEDVEQVIRRDLLQVLACVFLWIVMFVFRL